MSSGQAIMNAESEYVEDISAEVRAKHRAARKQNTSTDATYEPYMRRFTDFCHTVLNVSAAVTGVKLLQFLQHMKSKKTVAKKGSAKGGSHVEPEGCDRREYALKTLKGATAAIVDMWVDQEGKTVEWNGVLYERSKEHPRSSSVKSFLTTHRVIIFTVHL